MGYTSHHHTGITSWTPTITYHWRRLPQHGHNRTTQHNTTRAAENNKGRGWAIVPIPNNWCIFLNYAIVIITNFTNFCRHNNMTRRVFYPSLSHQHLFWCGQPLPIMSNTLPGGVLPFPSRLAPFWCHQEGNPSSSCWTPIFDTHFNMARREKPSSSRRNKTHHTWGTGVGFGVGDSHSTCTCTWPTHIQLPAWVRKPVTNTRHPWQL